MSILQLPDSPVRLLVDTFIRSACVPITAASGAGGLQVCHGAGGWRLGLGTGAVGLDAGLVSSWAAPANCRFGPPFAGAVLSELALSQTNRLVQAEPGVPVVPQFLPGCSATSADHVVGTEPVGATMFKVATRASLRALAYPAAQSRPEFLQLTLVTEFTRVPGTLQAFERSSASVRMRPDNRRLFTFTSCSSVSEDGQVCKDPIFPVLLESPLAWQP